MYFSWYKHPNQYYERELVLRIVYSANDNRNLQVCSPKFYSQRIEPSKGKKNIKNGALRFIDEKTEIINDSDYLSIEDYKIPVDDQLLRLALKIPCKAYIMTQDMRLKDKILQAGVSVIFVTYGKAILLRPN